MGTFCYVRKVSEDMERLERCPNGWWDIPGWVWKRLAVVLVDHVKKINLTNAGEHHQFVEDHETKRQKEGKFALLAWTGTSIFSCPQDEDVVTVQSAGSGAHGLVRLQDPYRKPRPWCLIKETSSRQWWPMSIRVCCIRIGWRCLIKVWSLQCYKEDSWPLFGSRTRSLLFLVPFQAGPHRIIHLHSWGRRWKRTTTVQVSESQSPIAGDTAGWLIH